MSKPEPDNEYDNYDGESNDDVCTRCGGEGFVELVDAPELWGEDCKDRSGEGA